MRGNRNYWTLLHLKYERHVFASHGGNGSKNKSFGKDGEDKVIEVPCGTVAYNAETGEYVCDITEHGQEVVLLKGGRGGLGNWHFRTATRQAPRFAQPGEPMQEMTVILELKLLADVGLVGFPNAGKSTLLSAVSAARPKIANYPFTTLEPNLGIVSYREGKSFVMADIPGIIEGASEGKGLGLRFLRHIERNSLLLFMVPGDTDDIRREYEILLHELATFNPEMLDKQRVLAVTKCDMLDDELIEMLTPTLPEDIPHVFISSVAGTGIQQLKDLLWTELNKESNRLEAVRREAIVHRPKDIGKLQEELKEMGEDEDFSYEYDQEEAPATLAPERQNLRVVTDTKQRKGKTVTLVQGFIGSSDDLETLARLLKNKCGTGGSAKDGEILIQGDVKEKVLALLRDAGYRVK